MLTIRPYKKEDYPKVLELLKELGATNEWESEVNLDVMVSQDPRNVLIAELDGEIVGQIILNYYGKEVVFLYRLVVTEKHRGKGIGTKIMEEVEKIAKEKGVREIVFYVNSQKEDLKNYYAKKGYQTTGRDFICMWKPL